MKNTTEQEIEKLKISVYDDMKALNELSSQIEYRQKEIAKKNSLINEKVESLKPRIKNVNASGKAD